MAESTFTDIIRDHIKEQLRNKTYGSYIQNDDLAEFLTNLTATFGIDYGKFEPFINGNYAVFMQHGTWFDTLKTYAKNNASPDQVKNYISLMHHSKNTTTPINSYPMYQDTGGKEVIKNLLQFSQTITDIALPEPNREYMAISTRQKNSFVNTRDFVGSDFSMSFIENKDLAIFKYMESWHKSIDLIREGLFFNNIGGESYFQSLIEENYLIDNPYCNTVWVAVLDSKGVELKGVIALFGVMPINLPTKTLIGDRGSPKITSYNLNFKFMDMQYTFIDGWEKLNDLAKESQTLAEKFFNFLSYSSSDANTI